MDPYPDRRWSNLQWNNNNNKNNNDDDDHNDNNDDDNTYDLLQKGEDRQMVQPVNGSTSRQKVEQSLVEQQ